MMKYDTQTDKLYNILNNINYNPIIRCRYGDFYYIEVYDKLIIYEIHNASKYINKTTLENMTKDNNYLVEVRRTTDNIFAEYEKTDNQDNIESVRVYKRTVEHITIPVKKKELISNKVVN